MNTPINRKLKNGHTMYDWIVRKKCYPAFCMRALAGEDKITAEEAEFLKSKGCKIGFVLNDLTDVTIYSNSAVYCQVQTKVLSTFAGNNETICIGGSTALQ